MSLSLKEVEYGSQFLFLQAKPNFDSTRDFSMDTLS